MAPCSGRSCEGIGPRRWLKPSGSLTAMLSVIRRNMRQTRHRHHMSGMTMPDHPEGKDAKITETRGTMTDRHIGTTRLTRLRLLSQISLMPEMLSVKSMTSSPGHKRSPGKRMAAEPEKSRGQRKSRGRTGKGSPSTRWLMVRVLFTRRTPESRQTIPHEAAAGTSAS